MTEDQRQLVLHKDFKMENFCLYNGKKIAKLETWDITSVELSSDYTSVIIQAESKSNKSEYTLDITSLISNQYADGLDPYSATIVNELTGVSDWVLDSDNNQIKYSEPQTLNPTNISKAWCYNDGVYNCFGSPTSAKNYFKSFYPQFPADFIWEQQTDIHWYLVIREKKESTKGGRSVSFHYVNNPFYNPNAEESEQPLPNIQYKSQDGILYQTMTALCSDYIPRSAYNTDYIFAGGARTVNGSGQPTPVEIGLRVQCDLKNRQSGSPTNTVGGNAVARTEAVPEEEKTLPLNTLAQQVISNAESGNVDAQKVALSAAFSPSIVSSLSDSDMQQWQVVKDAIGGLTGATEWTFDNADEVVRHAVITPDLNAVASTLTQRYSRSPSDFVGKDAFNELIEGFGWMVGEDGKVAKPLIQPPSQAPKGRIYLVNGNYFPNSGTTHGNFESCKGYYTESSSIVSCLQSKVKDPSYTIKLKSDYSTLYANALARIVNSTTPTIAVISTQAIELYKDDNRLTYFNLNLGIEPALSSQDPSQSYTPVSDSELQTALKNELESSNPDLAAAIADAITAAYTYDVVGFNELYDSLSVTYQKIAERIAQNSKSVDQSIVLSANAYITEALLKFTDVDSLSSQFEANKQPK